MFIQVYRKGTKRKVISFDNVHRIVIVKDNLLVCPLTKQNESFDLSLFDFYIFQ